MGDNTFEKVEVNSVEDIKRLLQEFLPGNKEKDPMVSAEFETDRGKVRVNAPTGCSYFNMFHEGFEMLRKRHEVLGKVDTRDGLSLSTIDNHTWLDDLIERRLGGKRDGLSIVWVLDNSEYRYDPFTGKLTRCLHSKQ